MRRPYKISLRRTWMAALLPLLSAGHTTTHLTLPIQAALGLHPFGKSMKPDESATLTQRLQER